MNDCISTYRTDLLNEYFRTTFKKPRVPPWLSKADTALDSVSITAGPVKIGKIKDTFREWTIDSRYRSAAWRWLRPTEPACVLDDLPALQRLSGLDHLDQGAFVPRLRERCMEEIRQHPRLRRWIERRLALLDFVLSPPVDVSEELNDVGPPLRQNLMLAVAMLAKGQLEQAALKAQEISSTALAAAAVAVRRVLGTSDCKLSANLMIPTVLDAITGPQCASSPIAKGNAERGAELWHDVSAVGERCLLVVAETASANHLGFWIPLAQGNGKTYLPGAPSAYISLEGAAVFQDDLPDLVPTFSETLDAAWKNYMVKHFKEAMFVSIPFRLDSTTGPTVGAVLNVNATPHPDDGWRRAYHREWLRVARNRAAPLIEVAYWAAHIRRAAQPTEWPQIDSGTPQWDTFPVVVGPLLLGPGESR